MKVRVLDFEFHVLNMRTRMPFKYGIASLTALPHLFLTCRLECGGRAGVGVASEGLPPKWFTKDPATRFEQDLEDMLGVIREAVRNAAEDVKERESLYEFWKDLYDALTQWGKRRGLPPLLTGLGASLVERSLLDGCCRIRQTSFFDLLKANEFKLRLEDFHPELSAASLDSLLPSAPLNQIHVRHTVGLADPLTDEELKPGETLNDGLPQTLEASVREYGLKYFKIKVRGKLEEDLERVRRIATVLDGLCGSDYAFTLDGNEQFETFEGFRGFWDRLRNEKGLKAFWDHLLFVEQPLHRDHALNPGLKDELRSWKEAPPMIIDESDGEIGSLRRALDIGYSGTSHKNCKGVFKGIANGCHIRRLKETSPERTYVISSEDLANVGPVALLQDLAVAASLGVGHSERNGHHYFKGLSMFPESIQRSVLESHPDLYRPCGDGWPALKIQNGRIQIGSVAREGFGPGFPLDASQFVALKNWDSKTLDETR